MIINLILLFVQPTKSGLVKHDYYTSACNPWTPSIKKVNSSALCLFKPKIDSLEQISNQNNCKT